MRRALLVLALSLFGAASPAVGGEPEIIRPPRFRVRLPETVLSDVPVKFVRIEALDRDGKLDASYNGRPLIEGVMLTVRDRKSGVEVDTALGPFENGVLLLETNLQQGRKVYVTASEIVVDPQGRDRTVTGLRPINRWWSIVPPLLAVVLAVVLKNVLLALFAGIWSGAVILLHGDVVGGFVKTLETHLIGEITQRSASGEPSHLLILLFTMFLGAMVGVMARSGGSEAIVKRLARFTKTRERGQLLTWGMGFAVFFDDYANTLLVGGTMRPVTDRLKISREKLAFLVDSTAAPVAGLAVISTWVGVEVSYIQDTYGQLFGSDADWNAYSTFLASIPYRFYSLHLLVFVLLIACSGHDFGPMLRAEARALKHGDVGAVERDVDREGPQTDRHLLRNALIPLVVLIAAIGAGLWWTGSAGLEAANARRLANGEQLIPLTLQGLLQHSSSNRVIFFAAFLASAAAVASAVAFRSLNLGEAIEAWIAGAKSMFSAILILVMAWSVATICDAGHLNTAGFLVELAAGRVSAGWVPALAFLLGAAVSFATGSSFATMGLLMPLFIRMTFALLTNENDADPNHPLMLAAIGAVLAGSIFGDHCSPISDTTVLSSAASGCDHLAHVGTQFPYALCVAGVALLLGYLPVGLGFSPLIVLPLALMALYVLVMFVGRPAEDAAGTVGVSRRGQQPNAAPDRGGDAAKDSSPEAKSETEQARQKLEQVSLDDVDVDWESLPGG